MPIQLPPKVRAKALPVRKQAATDSVDWLGLWALSLGLCAIVLAGIAYFLNGDNTGASGILIGAAGVIAVVIGLGAERDETSED